MFIPFKNLNPQSRIWIYQANRLLTTAEENEIKTLGHQFIDQWTAHNNNLLGSFEIYNHLFLIVAVDETMNQASGCSIDKSMAFIQMVEKNFSLNLLNRQAIAYETDGKINLTTLPVFERLYKDGKVNTHVPIYNNLISTKKELDHNWKIPMNNSWLMQVIS